MWQRRVLDADRDRRGPEAVPEPPVLPDVLPRVVPTAACCPSVRHATHFGGMRVCSGGGIESGSDFRTAFEA